ncbi:MAG: acyltransferase [Candidatus Dormibacteraeota bacterium]|nr:acyltransferase [Candidatus Dormibacteraeota bacterium]
MSLVGTVRSGGSRLAGVDGLRAAAALWVVLFHMRAFSGVTIRGIPGLDLLIRSGSTGVSLFLVISGFCLYRPFAAGRSDRFQVWAFLKRRSRRLMPAYYASLLGALVLVVVGGTALGFPALTPLQVLGQAVMHALMLQTLLPSTFYALNGAYWSLGLEWQLYLTLPVLIWIARRRGIAFTVLLAVGVNVVYRLGLWLAVRHGSVAAGSLLATAVLPNLLFGRWAEFAYGMLAAELSASGRLTSSAPWYRWLRWSLLLLVPLGFLLVNSPLSHLVFGAVFFVLLLIVLAGSNPIAAVFSWRPLVGLGVMSYSLYLVHQPVIQALAHVLRAYAQLSTGRTFAVLVLLLPAIIGLAWILFVTVERRTLNAPERRPASPVAAPAAPPASAAAGIAPAD